MILKEGNKIQIKPSKRGTFTKYCGGEVTDECIKKGKKSSDPAIRKKAVFAQNARQWAKKAQDGTKLSFGQQVGNFISENPELISTAMRSIKTLTSGNSDTQAKEAELKAYKKKTWAEKYKDALALQKDRSDVVNAHNAYQQAKQLAQEAASEKERELNKEIAEIKQADENKKTSAIGDLAGIVGNIGINYLSSTIPSNTSSIPDIVNTSKTNMNNVNYSQYAPKSWTTPTTFNNAFATL